MTARSMAGTDFDYVRHLVREHAALLIEPGKEYLVESRLDPLARQEGFGSFRQLVASLRGTPFGDLHRRVVEAMTTNETSFLRDARVYRMLGRSVLPKLIAERSPERSLNIWCAACSTGQEPYSLAMLLREHRPSLEGWNIRVIASDISREVLDRARAGRYSQAEVNRGLPASLLVKHFEQRGATWEISPTIRRMVEFREINLNRAWPALPSMDLVLMRNVLIYFELETRRALLAKAGRLLRSGGYLLLGGVETTTNIDDSFEPVSVEGAVCYRRRSTARAAESPLAISAEPARETILVVDNEVSIRSLVARVLRGVGFTVLEAADAQPALKLVQNYTGQLDLVITDVVMATGSGPDLACKILDLRPGTKALLMSGYSEPSLLPFKTGDRTSRMFPNLLKKPFSPSDLVSRVRALLGHPSDAAPS